MANFTRSICTVFYSVILLASAPGMAAASPGEKAPVQSQCVQCHSDVKGLIRLSWKVEKLHPKSARSAETSGEG